MNINTVALIGLGAMGSQIAWRCVVNGITAYLHDQSLEQMDQCIEMINNWLREDKLPDEKVTEVLDRLHPCRSLEEAVQDVDLVFESVYEDLELKKKLHADIGRIASPQALQGSNTSSLLCTPMAEASGRPEYFINMNFNHKSSRLVELMWNPKTLKSAKKAALRWARQLKLVPVVCPNELMGYSFNRIWRAIKKESLFVADKGGTSPHDIDRAWMLNFDMPFGPFGLMDIIGLDTILAIEMQYYKASGDERDKPPKVLTDLVKSGHLGEKTKKGFYRWPNPEYQRPSWLTKEAQWKDKLEKD